MRRRTKAILVAGGAAVAGTALASGRLRSRVVDGSTAMNHLHAELRIEASVEHVWAFLCDTSRWHDWDRRSEYTDFSGPIDTVGTTFVESGRIAGREITARHTVVAVEPQRLLRHRSDQGFDVSFRFAPDGDATRLTFEVDYGGLGPLPGFLSRPLVEWVGRRAGHDFKALAEATVPVPA